MLLSLITITLSLTEAPLNFNFLLGAASEGTCFGTITFGCQCPAWGHFISQEGIYSS